MSLARRCSRTACGRPAVNTLTYVYADQTAVLGPLATYAEPHAYDLCELHSERLEGVVVDPVIRGERRDHRGDEVPEEGVGLIRVLDLTGGQVKVELVCQLVVARHEE